MPENKSIDILAGDLQDWKVGDPLAAKHLQQSVSLLKRVFAGVTPPRQIVRKAISPLTGRQFKVTSVFTDFFTAKPFDGVDQIETAFNIALPFLLRRTPFDSDPDFLGSNPAPDERNGLTYVYTTDIERVATIVESGDTEIQVIVPSYQEGDIIYAMKNIIGGTSTSATDSDGFTTVVEWVDMNADGRFWALKSE